VPRNRRIPLIAALVTLVVHVVANPHYGFFRDELYFVICGFHPAWGYVDQPPIVPLIAAGSQFFGHSLFALRAICALFAAGCVYTTCLLVIELGGGAFAQVFGALVAALTPALMAFGSKLSTDTVGLVLWPLAALIALRLVRGADPRWWPAFGLVVGLGIESKYTMIFFAGAMLVALLLVPQRRVLMTPWFFAGAAIALLVALPNAMWQAHNGFPMWTLLHNAEAHKNNVLSPLQYIATQLLITHPLLSPVWLTGLVFLLRRSDTRFLGIAFLLLIAQMALLHGKDYYPGDVYPIPIAAGAVAIEALTARRLALRPIFALFTLAVGIALVPLLMPVLPEATMSAYDRIAIGMMNREVNLAIEERTQIGNLPPDWADMHGWRELTSAVAGVYNSLPPNERARTAILASNYGEAAALDFFGPAYGLPPALSGHNQFWLWGTQGYSGDTLIDVHGDCQHDAHLFHTARVVVRFSDRWSRPSENDFPISLCTGITEPLAAYWPRLRSYI
jgi:hypothetical protein